MTLLTVSGLRLERGGRPILEGLGFSVARGDRWGIVGRNGTGKTSLFRALTGDLAPAAGTVQTAPGVRLALLDQDRSLDGAETLWDLVAAPFAELLALGRRLEVQAASLAGDPSDEALARYDQDQERFRREGGWEVQARVDRVLEGLGFKPSQARERDPATLSGGERGRAGLARQLVVPADVYLMDEPTNHLDLETTRWLEEHLKSLEAGVLVVSHDRAFLDDVVDHVLHLEAGTGVAYDAGYRAFVQLRAAAREARRRAYEKQQSEIASEEEYIRRNIAGQNTRQAQGRRTRLARLPRLSPPPTEEDAMALRLKAGERGGDQVLVVDAVSVAVEGRTLVSDFGATVRRGEVVGIVGPNGAGKTTLLRALLGEHALAHGAVRMGSGITPGYFRQDLSQVDPGRSMFDIVHDRRPSWDRGQVQGHLGRFGFQDEEVRRLAGTLSGGERARLALALLVLSRANLLVLDEPTNHLDVPSIEALEDALVGYDGTVLLVSHDRALLRALTTRVWDVREGTVTDFPGSFEEWEVREEEARRARESEVAESRRQELAAKGPSEAQRHREARKARQSARRAAQRAVEESEETVHGLEARVAELEAELAHPELYDRDDAAERATELASSLDRARGELEEAMTAWERAVGELEAL